MNRKTTLLSLMAILAIVQLAVPLSMINQREMALRDGVLYKFRTAPVDPADAFRGRYVALRIEDENVAVQTNSCFTRGQKVFAVLENDTNGFARVTSLSADRPAGNAAVPVTINYAYGTNAHIQVPFDRYYLSESAAPRAESAYRSHSRRGNRSTYVTVRVLDGFAVLEELYIDDVPIKDFLKKEGKK